MSFETLWPALLMPSRLLRASCLNASHSPGAYLKCGGRDRPPRSFSVKRLQDKWRNQSTYNPHSRPSPVDYRFRTAVDYSLARHVARLKRQVVGHVVAVVHVVGGNGARGQPLHLPTRTDRVLVARKVGETRVAEVQHVLHAIVLQLLLDEARLEATCTVGSSGRL
eukprot:6173256-Pleurochrysis_carterae.AAC.1